MAATTFPYYESGGAKGPDYLASGNCRIFEKSIGNDFCQTSTATRVPSKTRNAIFLQLIHNHLRYFVYVFEGLSWRLALGDGSELAESGDNRREIHLVRFYDTRTRKSSSRLFHPQCSSIAE